MNVIDVRKGMVVTVEDQDWVVLDRTHVVKGNKRSYIVLKIKSLKAGSIVSKRFRSGENVDVAFLERKPSQYLYKESTGYVFMDEATYEQTTLNEDLVGDLMKFVVENSSVTVTYLNDVPVGIELPASVELAIVETEPGVRGDTATNVTKRAVCETGMEIQVPLHIKEGERVKVDTRSGDFQGRA